ncbi:MAG: hypothetical protein U0793_20760 [Gemmataceae bacterium]
MAKQRDEHDQPRKKKEDSDIIPLDDLDVLEEVDELEEVEPVEPPDPKKTHLGKKQSQPTMLAPEGELEELEAVEEAKPAKADDPKKTRVAPKQSQPTMIAPEGELEKAGQAPPGKSPPGKSPINMSLEGEEEVLDVLEAAPSGVLAKGRPATEAPASDVVDLVEIAGGSSAARKPDSGVVELTSDVVAVEPVSGAKPASDVVELEEAPASGVVEVSSDVLAADEVKAGAGSSVLEEVDVIEEVPASGVVELGEEKLEPSARELASDVFSAEEASFARKAKKKKPADEESALEDLPAGPRDLASDIFSAESIDVEGGSGKVKKHEDEDVLDAVETGKGGSSVVNWDDVEQPASDIKATEKTGGVHLEATAAFDDAKSAKKKAEHLYEEEAGKPRSGVDRVAEALESGVDLDSSASKKKKGKADEEADLEALEAADASSAVDLGGPKKKKAAAAELGDESTEMDAEALEAGAGKSGKAKKKAKDEVDELLAEEELLAEDALLSEEEAAEGAVAAKEAKAKKKKSAEEEAEDMLLSDEGAGEATEEAVAGEEMVFDDEEAAKGKKKKSKLALMEDEEAAEDEEPRAKKKKKKRGEDEDEDGGVATLTRKPPKPKYGRRWLGGMLIGLLLAVGGAAAVWYFAPDLLEQIPASPNAKPKKKDDSLVARTDLDRANAELEEAKKTLADKELKLAAADADKKKEVGLAEAKAKKATDDLTEAKGKLDTAAKTIDDVQKALVKEKLVKGDEFDAKEFQAAVLGLGDRSRDYKEINDILAKADIKDGGSKGLVALFDQKKALDEELTAVNKAIEGDKLKGAKGVEELVKRRDDLAKERKALDELVVSAYKALAAKGDPRKDLVAAADKARRDAESPLAGPLTSLAGGVASMPLGMDKLFAKSVDLAALTAELGFYRVREPLITGPDKNIDLYLVLLQDRTRKDVDTPVREATWLLAKEAKSSPETEAKALYVLGLAERNQEKFSAAVKSFAAALDRLKAVKDAGLWAQLAKISHAELTDPEFYYVPQAERLAQEGNPKKAYAMLDEGLKAMPGNPHLLVERALLRAEAGRDAGRIAPADVVAIRDDAVAAIKAPDTHALASYALGLVDQAQNNNGKAETHFREAIKTARPGKTRRGMPEQDFFLIALTRVLESDGVDFDAAPPMKKIDEKKIDDKKVDDKKVDDDKKGDEKKADDKKADDLSRLAPVRGSGTGAAISQEDLLVLFTVAVLPPPDDDEEDAARLERIKERLANAEKLIASDNPKVKGQGYILKGKALFDLGKANEGLRAYMEGMSLSAPGPTTKDFTGMIEKHPAFSYPDSIPRPNRYVAEDHFGRGLHAYWAGDYVKAEEALRQAIYWFKDDARYHYYYGLALYARKGPTKEGKEFLAKAIYAFGRGSELEARNMPSSDVVNYGLERVQGELRQMLNRHRPSAITAFIPDEGKKK